MSRPALVLLNRRAHGGEAGGLYARVRPALAERFELADVDLDAAGAWKAAVRSALGRGQRLFLAAGGDGTVNALAEALLARRWDGDATGLTLGAVGLGSSNDFHKPVRASLHGIPLRIDASRAAPRDVVSVVIQAPDGRRHGRHFLVSASLGVTAAGNAVFNDGGPLLRLLKRRSTGAAVLYAAVSAILRHRDLPARLSLDAASENVAISNLSVLKTPHLAGPLRFRGQVGPADGRLGVQLFEGMGRLQLLQALARLGRGRLPGRPGVRHWTARRVEVALDAPAALELDGEVTRARGVVFDVAGERLLTCA